MTRRLQYQKRDPAAVAGDLCAGCKGGDHSNHVAALGSICVGCACGWKPPGRVRTASEICERCDTVPCRCAKSPILRPRRDRDSREAITHEAIPGHVLACGRCGEAIEDWREVGVLKALPCHCEAVDVPVWARNPKCRRRA